MTTQVRYRPFSTELPCSGLQMWGPFLTTFPLGGTGGGPILIPGDGMARVIAKNNFRTAAAGRARCPHRAALGTGAGKLSAPHPGTLRTARPTSRPEMIYGNLAKYDHLRRPGRLFCLLGAHFRQKRGLFDPGTPPRFRGGTSLDGRGTSLDAGGTTPKGGGTTPKGGGMAPKGRGTPPKGGGTAPFRRGTAPEGGGTSPPTSWTSPDAGGMAPLGPPSSTGALRTPSPSRHHRRRAALCVHAPRA
jgi:hypothetical protein